MSAALPRDVHCVARRRRAPLARAFLQFNNQEAAANGEILNVLQYVRPGSGFVPAFPLTQKLMVNGAAVDPMWTWAKAACAAPAEVIADSSVPWLPIRSTGAGVVGGGSNGDGCGQYSGTADP